MGILPMRFLPDTGKMPVLRFSAKLPVLGVSPVCGTGVAASLGF
jgi:hypothetical protein